MFGTGTSVESEYLCVRSSVVFFVIVVFSEEQRLIVFFIYPTNCKVLITMQDSSAFPRSTSMRSLKCLSLEQLKKLVFQGVEKSENQQLC